MIGKEPTPFLTNVHSSFSFHFLEVNDCILSHIRNHYNNKYCCMKQLAVLTYLHKLIIQWAVVEYPRCLANLGRQSSASKNSKNRHPGKGEPAKASHKQKDTCGGGFFTSKEKIVQGEGGENIHVGEDTNYENPLKSIADLTELFGQWTELALIKLLRPRGSLSDNSRLQFNVFVNEVLSMYLTMSRCFINANIPIRPEMPSSIVYMCLFSSCSHFLSAALEYIAVMRQEIIPMCERFAEGGDENVTRVAGAQIENMEKLNMIAKDVFAVLGEDVPVREGSIFRLPHWEIEHDDILKQLSLSSHPALLPYTFKFFAQYATNFNTDQGDRSGSSVAPGWQELLSQLRDPSSKEYDAYFKYLEEHVPNVTNTFELLGPANVVYGRNAACSTIINTTSGVSSMKPSKRSISKRIPDTSKRDTHAKKARRY